VVEDVVTKSSPSLVHLLMSFLFKLSDVSKTWLFLSSTKEWSIAAINVTMVTNRHIRKLFQIAYDRNSLNYPFPFELRKTTQSDMILVIGGNGATLHTRPPCMIPMYHTFTGSTFCSRYRTFESIVCQIVSIGQTFIGISRFFDCQDGGRAPSWIFERSIFNRR